MATQQAQGTWVVEGMTLVRPTTAEQAHRIADRWHDTAASWEAGSAEQFHCDRVSRAFRKVAREMEEGTL